MVSVGERAGLKLATALVGGLCLTLALVGVAEAKKAKTFSDQQAVNVLIPPTPGPGVARTPLISEIKVPKKYKKKVVGDVNVTGFRTTGSGAGSADDLGVYLTAPSGRSVLIALGIGDISIGPLTMDDDTSVSICSAPAPCVDPLSSLGRPFAGSANLLRNYVGVVQAGPLSNFDGVKMRGTWTLTVYDADDPTTSTLNQWGLRIKPARPVSD